MDHVCWLDLSQGPGLSSVRYCSVAMCVCVCVCVVCAGGWGMSCKGHRACALSSVPPLYVTPFAGRVCPRAGAAHPESVTHDVWLVMCDSL